MDEEDERIPDDFFNRNNDNGDNDDDAYNDEYRNGQMDEEDEPMDEEDEKMNDEDNMDEEPDEEEGEQDIDTTTSELDIFQVINRGDIRCISEIFAYLRINV